VKTWLKQNNLSHYIPAICVDDIINTTSCDVTAVGNFYFHMHPTVNISLRHVEILNVLPMPPKSYCMKLSNLEYQFPLPKLNAFTEWDNSTAAEYVKTWLKQNNLSHYIPAICVDDIINTTSCDVTAVGNFYFHMHPTVNISLRHVEILNVLPMPPKSYCMKLSTPALQSQKLMACDYSLPLKAVGELSPAEKLGQILSAGDVNKLCEAALPFKNYGQYQRQSLCPSSPPNCLSFLPASPESSTNSLHPNVRKMSSKHEFLDVAMVSHRWFVTFPTHKKGLTVYRVIMRACFITLVFQVKAWLGQNNLSRHIPAICVDDVINTASCDVTAVGYFYFHVHPTVNISLRHVEILDVLPMPPKSYCMKLS
ncbi:hypothetical protein T265_13316, partial [Opisthorchis viverrini]